MEILGIDIGGSGIKGAVINTENGELLTERHRIATPNPAKPENLADTVLAITTHFNWKGSVGCGFPAVVQQGIVRTASNIHKKWIGTNARELFSTATGTDTWVINDADAAGIAEIKFGAGKDFSGVILVITVGTGLGTSVFTNGQLLPNSEFGHILVKQRVAERFASDATRKRKDLSWKKWGRRFNKYLMRLEELIYPDLIIIGGGASKKFGIFAEYLSPQAEIVPAQLLNHAGIIGAALAAEMHLTSN